MLRSLVVLLSLLLVPVAFAAPELVLKQGTVEEDCRDEGEHHREESGGDWSYNATAYGHYDQDCDRKSTTLLVAVRDGDSELAAAEWSDRRNESVHGPYYYHYSWTNDSYSFVYQDDVGSSASWETTLEARAGEAGSAGYSSRCRSTSTGGSSSVYSGSMQEGSGTDDFRDEWSGSREGGCRDAADARAAGTEASAGSRNACASEDSGAYAGESWWNETAWSNMAHGSAEGTSECSDDDVFAEAAGAEASEGTRRSCRDYSYADYHDTHEGMNGPDGYGIECTYTRFVAVQGAEVGFRERNTYANDCDTPGGVYECEETTSYERRAFVTWTDSPAGPVSHEFLLP